MFSGNTSSRAQRTALPRVVAALAVAALVVTLFPSTAHAANPSRCGRRAVPPGAPEVSLYPPEDLVAELLASVETELFPSEVMFLAERLPGIATKAEVAPLYDARLYAGYRSSDMVEVSGTSRWNTIPLHPLAAHAFEKMRDAAQTAGHRIEVWSGWRPWNLQNRAYENFKETGENLSGVEVPNVAHPCASKHPAGLAVDFEVRAGSRLHRWLRQNAATFGFENTRWDEPWEWQFTGIEEPGTLVDSTCDDSKSYQSRSRCRTAP